MTTHNTYSLATLHSMFQKHLEQILEKLNLLTVENQSLRQREVALQQENLELQHKNELAKARVEAIILRLRALEQHQEHGL